MQKIVYQTDSKGFYIGETIAYNGRIPNGAIEEKPIEVKDGYVRQWTGTHWKYVENHLGEKGYIDNKPFEVKEYGALPEGFTTEYVKSENEIFQDEINSFQAALDEIDRKTVRPLRAKMSGKGSAQDEEILAELESQAETIRIKKQEKEIALLNL